MRIYETNTECPDKRYKKNISRKLIVIYVSGYGIGKENSESFFYYYLFRARLTRVRQLVTFGEPSNDVDTTGTSSMCVIASRVVISYGCVASF